MSACPLVVLACESLHVCTVCIWRCEHARFCVEGFYVLYKKFHSFIHRLTADKKLQKVVRWSPLSETGQKSDSMFATIIRTALFYTVLFTLFRIEFFRYPDAFKNLGGGVYLKRIYNKITKPMCYHYCFYATMRHAA